MGQVTIVRDHAAASRATCVSTELSNAAVLLGRIAKPGKGADTTDYSTAQADISVLKDAEKFQTGLVSKAGSAASFDDAALLATLTARHPR